MKTVTTPPGTCCECGKPLSEFHQYLPDGTPICYVCHTRLGSIPTGRKDDAGKPRMGLVPFDALVEVAKVLTYGTQKYAPDNWKKVPDAAGRYTDALLRHFAAWQGGEVFDPEAGDVKIRHIAQVACNALFLIWFELQKEKENGSKHGNDN